MRPLSERAMQKKLEARVEHAHLRVEDAEKVLARERDKYARALAEQVAFINEANRRRALPSRDSGQ